MSHGDDRQPEFILIGFVALAALLDVQVILTFLIPNTNYSISDGWMAKAIIHTAVTFGRIFHVTNINPLEGSGSQLLPLNVWASPAYWPFFVLETRAALDISTIISLGFLAVACFALARCFDVPVLPSIVAAQSVIVLFGPLARMLGFFQVFWVNPPTAIVYAPQLLALGILGRLEPGRSRDFILATAGMFALLLYSLACDPLWTAIGGIGLLAAFGVVTLSPLRLRPILVRCAALGCCAVLLLASGAIEYLYTLTQYTARVWFSELIHYRWHPLIASVVFIHRLMWAVYGICALGWLSGLLLARGRVRVLVMAAVGNFAALVIYIAAFYFLPRWWLPLPIYIEHAMFPLFMMAAIAGYWAALGALHLPLSRTLNRIRMKAASTFRVTRETVVSSPGAGPPIVRRLSATGRLGGLLVAVSVPAAALLYGSQVSRTAPDFYEPLPNESELVGYLADNIGLHVGGEFRGSVTHVTDGWTLFALWLSDVPTLNEYSQLITPTAMYLDAAMLKDDVSARTVWLDLWTSQPRLYEVLFRILPALGVRYIMSYARIDEADQHNFPFATFPSRAPPAGKPAEWFVYELPHPNLGNYSPTEVTTASTGAEAVAAMGAADFDFTRQVVLATPVGKPLVPANNMRVSIIRGGLHVSGKSDGTSLVLLPQQYSNCLRPHDARVRLVRADLVLAGMIFSGEVDTDILFDYGIFSPYCRRLDLREAKEMQLKID